MGIELALGIASLAVGVISGINQVQSGLKQQDAYNKAAQAADSSAAAQKEANSITVAQQGIAAVEDRRQRVREQRVRLAQMQSASESTGTSGSSGSAGGQSALGTNFGVLSSQSRSVDRGNQGLNYWNQVASDFDSKARSITGYAKADAAGADAFSSFLNIFSTGFKSAGSIFSDKE